MLIAYVDESYNRNYYYIGAAIGDETAWEQLAEAYDEIHGRTSALHDVAPDAEFHGHEIMGGSGEWADLRGKHREAAGLYTAVLRAGREAGLRYIFRGVDVGRLNARYAYPRPPHDIVLGHLLERINDVPSSDGESPGTIVVADQISTHAEHQAQFAAYQEVGTEGYRSSRLQNISAPINFADSRLTPGLQAVDMATYVHLRAETSGDQHPRAQAVTKRLTGLIYPATTHKGLWRP